MLTAAETLNAIDEAKDVFRSARDELLARARRVNVYMDDCNKAKDAIEDVLSDLFFALERELEDEK